MIPEEKFPKEEERNLQKNDPEKKSENTQNKSWYLNKNGVLGAKPPILISLKKKNHFYFLNFYFPEELVF